MRLRKDFQGAGAGVVTVVLGQVLAIAGRARTGSIAAAVVHEGVCSPYARLWRDLGVVVSVRARVVSVAA